MIIFISVYIKISIYISKHSENSNGNDKVRGTSVCAHADPEVEEESDNCSLLFRLLLLL